MGTTCSRPPFGEQPPRTIDNGSPALQQAEDARRSIGEEDGEGSTIALAASTDISSSSQVHLSPPASRARPLSGLSLGTNHRSGSISNGSDNRDVRPTPAGENLCLDAFSIALNQAHKGREKRWYTSTLELQLVCLAVCCERRSIPTLHVHVDEETPNSLWDPETHISGRVPPVLALQLVWVNRRTHAFLSNVGDKRWEWLEDLRIEGIELSSDLEPVVWPPRLERLLLDQGSALTSPSMVWPPSLRKLEFGKCFTLRSSAFKWPFSLQQLSIWCYFDQPITRVRWPTSLQRLSFGKRFNQPIAGVEWPTSLQQLSFGERFNRPIAEVEWSASLRHLSFGKRFNQPIAEVQWPVSLECLSFGEMFNQPIIEVVWPASLRQLSFGHQFSQPIAGVSWPTSAVVVTRDGISLL
ncbi:unnamed protein product [Ectocarpus sp. 12 AP-2014]